MFSATQQVIFKALYTKSSYYQSVKVTVSLTSVIIFPRVFVRSRWAARLRFWVRTLSRVVRYSRANSLMILQN